MTKPAQTCFDFDAPLPTPDQGADSVLFAPIPSDDRALIVLQIARDLDTLKQEDVFVVPDRAFYEARIAALRRLLQ